MIEPEFLTVEEVEDLHREQLKAFGGLDGVRDRIALNGSVNAPTASFDDQYLYPDLFLMAAVYAFSISQAQAFFDGNKRTGLYVALYFLAINGWELNDPDQELYPSMIAISTKTMTMTKEMFAEILRRLGP